MTNQIRAIRRLRGLSPETVADATGVSRSTIYRWESGESNPGSAALCRLADLLGVTTDALLGLEDNTNEGGSNFKPNVTRNGVERYVSKRGVTERYSHRVMNYHSWRRYWRCARPRANDPARW